MFCGIWETAYPFVHATKSLFVLFIAFVFTALALTQALSKVKKRLVEKEYDEGRINRNQELAGIYTGEPGPNERAYTGEVFTDENGI